MTILRIIIPVKFTQANLDEIIAKYYARSKNLNFSSIIFDLSIMEWINTEEIAFLFAWITYLYQLEQNVKVWLPYTQDIYAQNLYKDSKDLIQIRQYLPLDGPDHIKRRRSRNVFLLSVWGMLDNLGLSSSDFVNIAENYNAKGASITEKYSHKIIPFTVISSQKPTTNIANPYQDVINGSKTINIKRNLGPFDLTGEITSRLKDFNCYTPFENKIISNIITKELFANSLIHANISGKLNGMEQCFFALSLNNKWENSLTTNFVNQFTLERDSDTLDFFKDKSFLLSDIRNRIRNASPEQLKNLTANREADLTRYSQSFKNISYLEFTFLDFGDGIHQTLDEKFQKFLEVKEAQRNFKNSNPDNQILEYAFFTESSRNQYDDRLESPELFPRGLYFLVDMVRRYKGLLTLRSGEGKVVYDFSDRIYLSNREGKLEAHLETTTTLYDAIRVCKSENATLEGTMITIVLPERSKEDVSYDPVRIDSKSLTKDIYLSNISSESTPRAFFSPETFEYINMLFLYERVIIKITQKEIQKPKGFDSLIYIELLTELKLRSENKCLIFIDFEHYPRTDNIQQLLFYLTNSPYVNERCKVIILNLEDTESTDKNHKNRLNVLKDFKLNLYAKDNEPHIFRPIPSINFDMYEKEVLKIKSIQWIGVQYDQDEYLLNKLLLGEIGPVAKKSMLSKTYNVGNIFAYNQDYLYPIFDTNLDLIQKFEESRHDEICKLIQSQIIDGSVTKPNKKKFIYQAAKGSFQIKYLTLYEILHNKYLAKFFAKRLLDQYFEFYKHGEIPVFNKIITVTVSSQLLGVAIRDLIHEDPIYSFLKIGKNKSIESCPKLIILSSYYSFEDEKPFLKIDKDDRVLIVNDVISTGSLVQKLIEGATKRKNAHIVGVMSIADARLRDDEIDLLTEERCFFQFNEAYFFSLLSSEKKEIELRKYRDKTTAIQIFNSTFRLHVKEKDMEVKRINPLLNTVVELSDEYGEKQRVLFTNPEDFLPKEPELRKNYQTRYLKVGHFVQNLSHNSYLTNMRLMFSDDEGVRILKLIKREIDNEYQNHLYHVISDDKSKLFSMKSLAEQIEDKDIGNALIQELEDLLSKKTVAEEVIYKDPYEYRPHFIFYPIFSGVENISHTAFHNLFGTAYENIINLQRFDTDKGWRFPFPPKRFNNITKGRHVLIFDSGALTGESLVQMIDSISFLEVGKIDVISVIGRIEDYNREFFSRIKAIKVKNLNDKQFDRSLELLDNKEFVLKNKISFANLNIIFGLNFHIPVYPSKSMCPFCEEIADLKKHVIDFEKEKYPDASKAYITSRLKEIDCVDLSVTPETRVPNYFPRLRKINDTDHVQYDLISIFLMRDKLGKIDSYRFYKEYYFPFDDEIIIHLVDGSWPEIEVLKKLELIMISILHEPKLYKVHKDLLVNIHDKCKSLLSDVLQDKTKLDLFFYEWKSSSILRLICLYFESDFFELKFMQSLLNFSFNDQQSLNHISFSFVNKLKSTENRESFREQFIVTLLSLSDKLENDKTFFTSTTKIRPMVMDLIAYLDPTDVRTIDAAFYNLRMFFEKRSPENKHNLLKEKISYLRSRIKNKIVAEIEEMTITAQVTVSILREEVLTALNKIKETPLFKTFPEFEANLLFGNNSVSQNIKNIIKEYENVFKVSESAQISDRFNSLADFTDLLVEFQFEFLIDASPFYNFCKNYPCQLSETIDMAWEELNMREKNKYNVAIQNDVEKDYYIPIHKSYLTHCLIELFNNALKEEKNESATISFIPIKSNNVPTLVISQDKPFLPNYAHSGGLTKTVLPTFESFFGNDNVNAIYTEDAFVIQINLSVEPRRSQDE